MSVEAGIMAGRLAVNGDRAPRRLVRRALVASTATVATVATATTVFACTGTMGGLTFTPTSGLPGTIVSTTATGLKPFPAQYDLFFGGTCMTFSGKLLKTISTNSTGGWTNEKVMIPKRVKVGSYGLCGVEAYPNAGATATTHNSFTVV